MAKSPKPGSGSPKFSEGSGCWCRGVGGWPRYSGVHAQPAEVKRTRSASHVSRGGGRGASGAEVLTADRTGSDYMVDVLKTIGFEYVCANPGSSFRGIHESIINYGGNKSPEFITCCHEESSVAMAHGYYKIEGKPLAVLAHGTVGVQHAAMAMYNAYCDRVPVYLILGNIIDETKRAPGRGVVPQRAGRGGDGARFYEVGRPAHFARAFWRVRRARLQSGDDAADHAGRARGRRRFARECRFRPMPRFAFRS